MSSDKQRVDGATDDPGELREEIEKTREELGDTVEALSHKVDVKGRVSDGIDDRKHQAKETAAHARETVTHAAAAAQQQAAEAAASARATAEHAAASARATAEQAGQKARANRTPVIAAAAGVAVLLALIVRKRRSR